MSHPLDFKQVVCFSPQAAAKAIKLVKAVFVGPVPESVIWAVALAFDEATFTDPEKDS